MFVLIVPTILFAKPVDTSGGRDTTANTTVVGGTANDGDGSDDYMTTPVIAGVATGLAFLVALGIGVGVVCSIKQSAQKKPVRSKGLSNPHNEIFLFQLCL